MQRSRVRGESGAAALVHVCPQGSDTRLHHDPDTQCTLPGPYLGMLSSPAASLATSLFSTLRVMRAHAPKLPSAGWVTILSTVERHGSSTIITDG